MAGEPPSPPGRQPLRRSEGCVASGAKSCRRRCRPGRGLSPHPPPWGPGPVEDLHPRCRLLHGHQLGEEALAAWRWR